MKVVVRIVFALSYVLLGFGVCGTFEEPALSINIVVGILLNRLPFKF
jgi:hypothetical protein